MKNIEKTIQPVPDLYTGIALRILMLSFTVFSLWMAYKAYGLHDDEYLSLVFSGFDMGQKFLTEANGYLYYLGVLRPWAYLFGLSTFAIRIPSVIAGVISLYLLFLITCKISGTRSAVFTCLFFTVNGTILHYSSFCRFYAVNLLFCLLATWVFLKYLDSGDNKLAFLYSFLTIVCLATQVSSSFLFTAHGLYFLLKAKNKLKAFIIVLLQGGLLAGFLAFLIYYDPTSTSRIAHYPEVSFSFFSNTLLIMLGLSHRFVYTPSALMLSLSPFLLGPFISLIRGFFVMIAGEENIKHSLLVVLWASLPVILMAAESHVYTKIFDYHTLYFVIPSFCIILGTGLNYMPKWLNIAVLLSLAISMPLFVYYNPID